MQFSKRLRPSADGELPDEPILGDHGAPFLVPPERYPKTADV
jgi:hypothetical protein